jgi:(R,R)-butanediol dehydrogenase/meso-butanediol dehydrogenase/diacetyl reductase
VKGALYHGSRDVRVESVPEPLPPAPHEVLLEVVRASICGTDVGEFLHGPQLVPLERRHPVSGHIGPLILGHEILGRVVSVGSAVESVSPGDRVVPGAGIWCGRCSFCRAGRPNLCDSYYTVGIHRHGGLAELVSVPAEMCVPVSDACADDHAVMGQPLAVALHAVRRGAAQPGESVAVIGAGAIGAMIVAGSAALGLSPLAAVDLSTDRLEGARRLGATHLVNASEEDPVPALRGVTGGEGAHVVIEASGTDAGLVLALAAVRRGGRVVVVGIQAEPRAVDLCRLLLDEVEIVTSMAHVCEIDLPEALRVLERSDLGDAMLDRVIALDDVVEDGIIALSRGDAHGKVVVTP